MQNGYRFWEKSEMVQKHPLLKLLIGVKPLQDTVSIKHCLMLRMEGKTAVCMLQEFFGYDAKPDICKEYFCENS